MNQTTPANQSGLPASGPERRGDSGQSGPVERDETHSLISSDKVEGTRVYSNDGEHIGHISHMMIGKRSGRVEYAVMNFGSFLGIGGSYHPLPWDALDYDTDRGGYVVSIDKSKLREAPSYRDDAAPAFDRQYGQAIYNYYGLMY